MTTPMLLAGSPFSKATRRISDFLERDLAPHRREGHIPDLVRDAGQLRQLVDAFLPDHRRVHVGEQQPLAAARGIDQGDIDRPRRQRPPQLLLAHGRHQAFEDELAGFRLGQPDRRAEARLLEDGERLAVNGA